MANKRKGLGRGLDALLSAANQAAEPAAVGAAASSETLKHIPVDVIRRSSYQPRRAIDRAALEELASSIREQGVLQPIVVRPVGVNQYEIIAGERRWRASQLAGLDAVPAVVRQVADEVAAAIALIENIQRENLNPLEEAMALQRLQQDHKLTQQEVAEAIGKSRSTVTNLLRLTGLQEDVRRLLESGNLEMGHARALLGLPAEEQGAAARAVVAKALSVRQTEALVRGILAQKAKPAKQPAALDPNVRVLQDELSEKLGTQVRIQASAKGKGRLVLQFSSLDQLDGILKHIR